MQIADTYKFVLSHLQIRNILSPEYVMHENVFNVHRNSDRAPLYPCPISCFSLYQINRAKNMVHTVHMLTDFFTPCMYICLKIGIKQCNRDELMNIFRNISYADTYNFVLSH